MSDDIFIDTKKFEVSLKRHFDQVLPAEIAKGVNAIATDLRKEVIIGSPRGPRKSPKRFRDRIRLSSGGYGPIWMAWKINRANPRNLRAVVFNKAFYAPMVEFGLQEFGIPLIAQNFTRRVVNRGASIAQRALRRVLKK